MPVMLVLYRGARMTRGFFGRTVPVMLLAIVLMASALPGMVMMVMVRASTVSHGSSP
jgi:hypothetical protein